ncbi:hypothetical protein ZWY2020_019176 [Hordeum vulgare]|nr:hypothetical protein ZWY2020_019176 [Hordeum vulgare]
MAWDEVVAHLALVRRVVPARSFLSGTAAAGSARDPPRNSSLCIFLNSTYPDPNSISWPTTMSSQFIRLESHGHVRMHEWDMAEETWPAMEEVTKLKFADCGFPTVYGEAVNFRLYFEQTETDIHCFWVTKVFSLQSIKLEHVNYKSTIFIKESIL